MKLFLATAGLSGSLLVSAAGLTYVAIWNESGKVAATAFLTFALGMFTGLAAFSLAMFKEDS